MLNRNLQPNEVLFYVNVGLVKSFTLTEIFNKLVELGYSPEPTYYWSYNNTKLESGFLLYRKIEEDLEEGFSNLEPKWEELADIFGSEAVNLEMNDNAFVV